MLQKQTQTHVDSLDGTTDRGLFTAFVDLSVQALYMKSDSALDWEIFAVHGGSSYLLLSAQGKSSVFSTDKHPIPFGSAIKVVTAGAAGQNPTVTMVWSPFE